MVFMICSPIPSLHGVPGYQADIHWTSLPVRKKGYFGCPEMMYPQWHKSDGDPREKGRFDDTAYYETLCLYLAQGHRLLKILGVSSFVLVER